MSRCPRCGFAKFKKLCPKCGARIDEFADVRNNKHSHAHINKIIVLIIMILALFLLLSGIPMRVFYATGTWIASHGKDVIWM